MKKTPAKKQSSKKAPAKPVAKKAVAKKAPAKKCACQNKKSDKKCGGKKECACRKAGLPKGVCFNALISDIFSQLEDNENLSSLMKDYFFTELLKRDIDENIANTLANKLNVTIESFEADIGFEEED